MNKHICLLICLLRVSIVLASNVGHTDTDKGGSFVAGLVDAAETFSQVSDAVGGVASVPGAASEVRDAVTEVKEVGLVKGLQGMATQIALPYTNSKASVLMMVNNALKKTNEVVSKVAKRVDMWRTTKPTIEKYYNAAGRLADDTKKLYKEFTWKKFFDPKRPWDKQREQLFDADVDATHWRGAYVRYCNDVRDYMTYLYNNANSKDESAEERRRASLMTRRGHIVPNVLTHENMPMLVNRDGSMNDDLIPGFQDAMVPHNALELSALILFTLDELQAEYKSAAKDSEFGNVSVEDDIIQRMMKDLNASETPVDTRNLSKYISERRLRVHDQAIRASQLRVQAQTYFANLFLREKEYVDKAAAAVETEYGILAMGRDNYEYYDQVIRSDSVKVYTIKGK